MNVLGWTLILTCGPAAIITGMHGLIEWRIQNELDGIQIESRVALIRAFVPLNRAGGEYGIWDMSEDIDDTGEIP